jgi:hypothetical protein
VKRLVLTLAAASLAALSLAGCGGDDDADDGGASTPTAQETTRAEASPAASATAQASPTTGGGATQATPTSSGGTGQVTGSGAGKLRSLARDLTGKTFQVSYAVDMGDGKGSMTFVQKPPKFATIIELTDSGGEGTPGTIALIDDGTNSYTCFKEGTDQGQCLKGPSGGAALTPLPIFSVTDAIQDLADDVNVTESGSRTIAGIDSECFTVKPADGSEGTACFAKEAGIATLIDTTTPDGTFHFEATEVATRVDDSVFAPPAGYEIASPE